MERWVKVVLGTLFASVGCFIFFLIYDRVMIYFRKKRHQAVGEPIHMTMKQVFRTNKYGDSEESREDEMHKLIYEEYHSVKHEVLAVCTENKETAAGLCIFLADREIEWYMEKFPECCVNKSEEEDYKYRNVLASVAHWASKWTLAEAVNLLCQDGNLVRNVAKGTTRQWRSFSQYEKKNSFRLFLQWSENYVCGEAVNEELWEETILSAKLILKGEEQKAFKNLPIQNWKIKRVKPSMECFHMVPHPGDITPVDSGESMNNNEKISYKKKIKFESESDELKRSLADDLRRESGPRVSVTDERRSVTDERRSVTDERRSVTDERRDSVFEEEGVERRESVSKDRRGSDSYESMKKCMTMSETEDLLVFN